MQTTTTKSIKAIIGNNEISATSKLVLEIGESQQFQLDNLEIFAETCPADISPVTFAQDELFNDELIPDGVKGKPMSINSFFKKVKTDKKLAGYTTIYNLLNAFKTAVSRAKKKAEGGTPDKKETTDKTRLEAILNILKACDNIPTVIEGICSEYNYGSEYKTVVPIDSCLKAVPVPAKKKADKKADKQASK